jgi:hypothetical protein
MSIALIVTAGFGNGTFNGTITDIALRGYAIGEEIPSVSISSKFRIEFAAEPRNIEIAYEDRTVRFPPTSRDTKL